MKPLKKLSVPKALLASITIIAGIAIILLGSTITGCKKEVIVEKDVFVDKITGCTDPSALNYNPNATVSDTVCIYSSDLDDTTRSWTLDKSHSNIEWETDFKDLGYSLLTGRFNDFDIDITFNEKDPTKTTIDAWVVLSSNNTGESGRDKVGGVDTAGNNVGGCGMRYLGVHWDGNVTKDTLSDGTLDPAFIDPTTDTAKFKSTSVEFNFADNGRLTTTYKATGTLTFNGATSTVYLYFNHNGIDYGSTVRSGFNGYFEMNAKSVHGVTSTSIADLVTVKVNAAVRNPIVL